MFRRPIQGRDIVHRWEGNPLIVLEDLDFMCSDIWSAGVASHEGDLILLVTIEHLAGHQSIHLARADEKGKVHVEETPFLEACRDDSGCSVHETSGVMDPKVVFLEGTYYIMYLANGRYGTRLGLATTKDFKTVDSRTHISEPDTKAGSLFPERIKGKYARLERPRSGGSIWITYSEDLIHWGGSELVMRPRGGFWDSSRIGAGAPPIRIDEGWLLIYYGVKKTSAGPLFRLGAAILDDAEPTRIVGRSNIPILSPRENYERVGNLSNMIFSSGALIGDGGEVQIFYSGADSCICLGTTSVSEIVDACSKSRGDF
jgi:predicted GH43/DUF377 family glycosyl hydrolase